MDLNNKSKKYIKINRETRSNKICAMLDGINIKLEDDIDNLMYDSDTEFVLEEILENELDSDQPLNSLVPEAK